MIKVVNIKMSEEQHKALKIEAINKGLTMHNLILSKLTGGLNE